MNFISIPVTLLLSKIESYIVALQEEKLYLSPGIGYRALSTWYTEYSKKSTNTTIKLIKLWVQTLRIRIPKYLRLRSPFSR